MQSKSGAGSFIDMDLGKFLESLKTDYKEVLIAIALAFPLSYLDCWKLYPAFRNYEIIEQIILAVAVGMIVVFATFVCYVASMVIGVGMKYLESDERISALAAVFPIAVTSGFVLVGTIHDIRSAGLNLLCAGAGFLVVAIVSGIARRIRTKNNPQDKDNEER